jgi:hypothetical protein
MSMVTFGNGSTSSWVSSSFDYAQKAVDLAGDVKSLFSGSQTPAPFGGQGSQENPIPLPGIAVEAERDYTPYLLGLALLLVAWKLFG